MTQFDPSIHASRRQRFLDQLGAGAAVIPAATLATHHADCEWPFRQDSDFFYLTGFDEPDAVALLLPHRPEGERFVLFVHPKDPAAEVWTGFRWGTEGAVERYGADIAHPLDQLSALLPGYLEGAEAIAFRVGRHPAVEPLVLSAWGRQLDSYARAGAAALGLVAPTPILHRLRLVKEAHELSRLREACRISAEAHELARSMTQPGMNEAEVQAAIESHFRAAGARGPAYGSIVAGGDNACVLHYTENADRMRAGDLVLIDAGCEYQGYAADITRTFPVNGRFSPEQRAIYDLVLEAQKAAIAKVKPGNTWNQPHDATVRVITRGLIKLGLLKGKERELIKAEAYRDFYMHRAGHWLGLDVHDVGDYRVDGRWRQLEPGMALTIEPGIYIAADNTKVAKRWRGIGVRIEDDVVVTEQGCDVLTSDVPKRADEIEMLMSAAS